MRNSSFTARLLRYVLAIGLTAAVIAVFAATRQVLDTTLVALLLLIPVGVSTASWGLGPGIAAALSAFLGFNYFFIHPLYTFAVHRPGDLVVLLVFLIVAVVISQLLGRAQAGMQAAAAREREATQLYELSTALAGLQDSPAIARILAGQIQSTFPSEYLVVSLSGMGHEIVRLPSRAGEPARPPDITVPIQAVKGAMGEIRLWRTPSTMSSGQQQLLRTFASQAALALERAALTQAESRARLLEESDRFKSSLLSSVSHELRTPLATIKAAASSLRHGDVSWDSPARDELLAAIDDETDHLNLLVGNLLDMSRIESGALRPQRTWNVLDEIVQSVLSRMRHLAENHELVVDIPEDLPLVPVDFVQMEQVFTNLISNSLKYAPPHTIVRIHASLAAEDEVRVQVANQGPPVPEEHLDRIFDKFYRITAADRVTGAGLGLSICKGIIQAHGGTIWAENLPGGFAFNFTLPLRMDGSAPPAVTGETEGP